MKHTLTLLLIAISGASFAQDDQFTIRRGKLDQHAAALVGDTMFINDIKKVKFIDINGRRYEIKPPTIEESRPAVRWGTTNGLKLYAN